MNLNKIFLIMDEFCSLSKQSLNTGFNIIKVIVSDNQINNCLTKPKLSQ